MMTFDKCFNMQGEGPLFSNRPLVLLVAAFFAWRGLKGLKGLFWTAFGLANAVYWSGAHNWR